jgi:hypothetical protein
MCYERRRAEACVDESAHHAVLWEETTLFFLKKRNLFSRGREAKGDGICVGGKGKRGG